MKLWKILVFIIFISSTTASAQDINRESEAIYEVSKYVEHWTQNIQKRFRMRAKKHIPPVAHWSTMYNIDPLLVSVMVSLESSWDPHAKGKKGEIGLMQVHSKEAKAGFDLNDPDQQIHAGVLWLKKCIDKCGYVSLGVNMYATGYCHPRWKGLSYRLRKWRDAIRLVRGEK